MTGDILQSRLKELERMKECDSDVLVEGLRYNQQRIMSNEEIYYNKEEDQSWIDHYYCDISFGKSSFPNIFSEMKKLVGATHKYRNPYHVSKDQYLYTWVDLQPYGKLKNIYSGTEKSPEEAIKEDFETIYKRFEKYRRLVVAQRYSKNKRVKNQVRSISRQYKFNVEHVVPQSWFRAKEPMKGDLHHLFTCEPECNSIRSNYPYYEFSAGAKPLNIYDECGLHNETGLFEPEYGKGIVARATLYFLLRYPNRIVKSYRQLINRKLMLQWHNEFPVTLYEKHRNKAIFEIQGNRNPFIDFPELTKNPALYTLL
ncbi:endonuclease I family protein [Alkalicoccus saliphilus]|uniref:Endonuclease I n=1 Tax=Alkalicoccus saliphilus TaxID=200989 RepID=A0A2T4U3W3_9BACI|nr:endonuclease [Alkalicoccus saliphilus]PTL38082.1 endonuclease I [Alkalicoccus saliphilus]